MVEAFVGGKLGGGQIPLARAEGGRVGGMEEWEVKRPVVHVCAENMKHEQLSRVKSVTK